MSDEKWLQDLKEVVDRNVEAMRHEDSLTHNRMLWSSAIQTVLIAGYLRNPNEAVPFVGFGLAVIFWFLIRSGLHAHDIWEGHIMAFVGSKNDHNARLAAERLFPAVARLGIETEKSPDWFRTEHRRRLLVQTIVGAFGLAWICIWFAAEPASAAP